MLSYISTSRRKGNVEKYQGIYKLTMVPPTEMTYGLDVGNTGTYPHLLPSDLA